MLSTSFNCLFFRCCQVAKVLADYIGRQPVSSKGHVQVVPPWRSDGRCGPQFPVGKAPGECDPYGGALPGSKG